MSNESQPDYLKQWRGLSVRKGDRIVDASDEDVAVAKGYAALEDKGPLVNGHRRTILTKKRRYAAGEEVRVIHVYEVLEPGHELLVMGPKPVYGEYVDGNVVRPAPSVPDDYDGPVLPSPNVDYNYEITSYVFEHAGRHSIYWQPDDIRSNTLDLEVVAS